MNYRHAYHAGNFADVLKHIVLTRVLEYMKKKPTPFRVLDAHGGLGLYDLTADAAVKTGEWKDGIGRLWHHLPSLSDAERGLLAPYIDTIASLNEHDAVRNYPGSPVIAAMRLRPSDRLVVNELHPEDAEALKSNLARFPAARVTTQDAYQFLKAHLPPQERRGVVLIDPAYEAPDERRRLIAALATSLDRFATGTYLIWYPVKDLKPAARLVRDISDLVTHYGLKPGLDIRLMLRPARNSENLNGSGVVVINPPHTLEAEMLHIMQTVAPIFATQPGGGSELATLGVQ